MIYITDMKMFWSVLAALIVFAVLVFAVVVGGRAVSDSNRQAVSRSCLDQFSRCMGEAKISADPKEAVQMCVWDQSVCGKKYKY